MDHPQKTAPQHLEADHQLAFNRLQQMAHFQAGFLGTASHELRAPINRIISLHQLILEDLCESPEEEREFLQQANQAIFEVLQNLDLLIQVSKLDIGAVSPKNDPVMVDGVLEKVRQLTEKKCLNRQCRLTVTAPSETLIAEGDDHWLQQLLLLLVDGAISGGSEKLMLSAQSAENETVEVHLITDVNVDKWTDRNGAEANDGSDLDAVDISPGFRYHLVERMAKHLNCSLTCRATPEGGSELVMGMKAYM
jgi:K+-sensing histidine kinase KdpD